MHAAVDQLALGDVVRFANGKSIKPGGEGRYPVYGSNGIIGGCDEYNHEDGVILGRVGAYCGSVALCRGKFWASDNTIVVYPKSEDQDVVFLYHALNNAGLNKYAGGAAQPLITHTVLKSVELWVPDLPTQRRIAGILSVYDELIANNQRRIAILEEMARALYREWFVHYRAPGVVMGEDGVPEGWEVKELAQLCTRMESGGTPLRSNPAFWEEGSIPWYKTKELWDGYLFEAEEAITPLAIERTSAKVFQPGTILMAIYGSPTVGRMGIVTKESSCNQAALGMVANEKRITQTFLYFALLNERERFNRMAQGAAQQNISKEIVARTEVIVPPRALIERFDKIARPMFDLNRTIQEQTMNLRRTRDLLLPRLMSGRVPLSIENE